MIIVPRDIDKETGNIGWYDIKDNSFEYKVDWDNNVDIVSGAQEFCIFRDLDILIESLLKLQKFIKHKKEFGWEV